MQIKLNIEGKTYEQVSFLEISFDQAVDEHLYPTDRPKGGDIIMHIPTDVTRKEDRHDYDYFMNWMIDSKMRKEGSVDYYSGNDDTNPAFTIKFEDAYCVGYQLTASAVKSTESSMEIIRISAKILESGTAKLDKTRIWPT
jgi:hypothetical protein